MRLYIALLLFISPAIYCQNLKQPLTQVEACRRFEDAVVRIDVNPDISHGTGFIVDPAGWIITALHVVANNHMSIDVSIHGFSKPFTAELVTPQPPFGIVAVGRDIAILKINKLDLPYVQLGNEAVIEDGSPIAVIGFPLSAIFEPKPEEIPKFCLAGTIAAQVAFPLSGLNYRHAIYFQGVSVKGISGAPIISLINGQVIGIVSTKLTGLSNSLLALRSSLITNGTGGIAFSGIGDPGQFALDITDVLDRQLANGLGSGTGAADAANDLNIAKQNYRSHRSVK